MAMNDISPTTPPSPRRPERRRFYSAKQVAFELGVSQRTVWRWIKAGKIKRTFKISIGRIGIPVEELDRIEAEIRKGAGGER